MTKRDAYLKATSCLQVAGEDVSGLSKDQRSQRSIICICSHQPTDLNCLGYH